MSGLYAYHILREDFQGEYILPLNQLQETHPKLAEKARRKYKGRENVMNTRVSDSLKWGDVSFSILHNPKLIAEAIKKAGFNWFEKSFFQIPIKNYSHSSLIWKYTYDCEDCLDKKDCLNLNQIEQIDVKSLPIETIEYFQQIKKLNREPLMFAYVPHLLCPSPIWIGNAKIITV
jgi:hypothetical protein